MGQLFLPWSDLSPCPRTSIITPRSLTKTIKLPISGGMTKTLQNSTYNKTFKFPNSTLDSLLAPFILNITFIHKTPLFSKTAESSDLLLLHTPHSHPNHRTNHDLHPSNIHSPVIAAKPEIFISRRSTTKQSQYRNLRFSETITTQKISNYLTSLFLSMSQRAVL